MDVDNRIKNVTLNHNFLLIETLPSYEDATKVRLLMPGSRHSSQNVLQPGSDDGQRSLNAAQDNSEPPPHYDELFQAP